MDLVWTKSSEEVLKYFDVDEEKGLSEAQVKRAREKYGPNGNVPTSPLIIILMN